MRDSDDGGMGSGSGGATAWYLTKVSRETTLDLSVDMVFCATVCYACNEPDGSTANSRYNQMSTGSSPRL